MSEVVPSEDNPLHHTAAHRLSLYDRKEYSFHARPLFSSINENLFLCPRTTAHFSSSAAHVQDIQSWNAVVHLSQRRKQSTKSSIMRESIVVMRSSSPMTAPYPEIHTMAQSYDGGSVVDKQPMTNLDNHQDEQVISIIESVYGSIGGSIETARKWNAAQERVGLQKRQDRNLIYGELNPRLFLEAIKAANVPSENVCMVDLGSGTGRLVLTAALRYPDWKECRGIELFASYTEQAHAFHHKLRRYLQDLERDPHHHTPPQQQSRSLAPVSLQSGDFTPDTIDLSKCDLVCSYCTTWASERDPMTGANVVVSIRDKVRQSCKKGSKIIVIDKQLSGDEFKEIAVIRGDNKDTVQSIAYIYEKVL